MTLNDLQRAIKPQFVWIEHAKKKFQVDNDARNGGQGFALVIMVGLADAFDIPHKDIMNFTSVDEDEFNHKLNRFQINWTAVLNRKAKGVLCYARLTAGDYDFVDRLYLKTKLTLNALTTSGINVKASKLPGLEMGL